MKQTNQTKQKNRWIIIFLAVVAAILTIIVGIIIANEKKKTTVVRQENPVQETQTEEGTSDYKSIIYNGQQYNYNPDIQTVLFLGIDKNPEDVDYVGTAGRSDSMILFIVDNKNQTVQMLNIPRESMVEVENYSPSGEFIGRFKEQITLQYSFGDGGKRSCWLTKKVVSKLLKDIPIDSYVAMNLDSIGEVTTLVGGIDLTIPEDYTAIDPSFIKGDTVHLQGDLAESYVRTRDIHQFGSNEGRMERQNQFLYAFVSQVKPKMNKQFLNTILDKLSSHITTDMTADQISEFMNASLVEESYMVPGERIQNEEDEPEEYNVDEDALEALLVQLLYVKAE